MNAPLMYMIVGRRSGELREAKPIYNRPTIGRRGRVQVDHCLRGPGAFRRGGCGFGGRVRAALVAVMALVVFAMTATVASADPVGQIREFSGGLNVGSYPGGIAPTVPTCPQLPAAAGGDNQLITTTQRATRRKQ